jgi:hypothetical protein
MDTREKIVSGERFSELLRQGNWVVLVGTFDPLTAEQTQRVAGSAAEGRKLAVVIERGEGPLLPAEARAALVAALRNVDAVVLSYALAELPSGVTVLRDAEGERERTRAFREFVLRRQAGVPR